MRWYSLIGTLLAAVACTGSACSKDKSGDADPAGQGTPVTIQRKFCPGNYFQTDEIHQQLQTQIEAGGKTMTQDNAQEIRIVTHIQVDPPDATGGKQMTYTFARFRMKSNVGDVDTDRPAKVRPAAAGPSDLMEAVYRAMLFSRIQFQVDDQERIVSVQGFDPMWDRILRVCPNPVAVEDLKKSFGEKALIEAVQAGGDLLPPSPVAPGATWNREVERTLPIIGTTRCSAQCSLEEIQDSAAGRMAKIHYTQRARKDEGHSDPVTIGGAKADVQSADLTTAGTLLFNVDTGMIEANDVRQTGPIVLQISVPGGQKALCRIQLDGTIRSRIEPTSLPIPTPPAAPPAPPTPVRPTPPAPTPRPKVPEPAHKTAPPAPVAPVPHKETPAAPTPINDVTSALDAMTSDNASRQRDAAKWFAEQDITSAQDLANIHKTLDPLLSDSNQRRREAALHVCCRFARKDDGPTLVKLAQGQNRDCWGPAMGALMKIDPASGRKVYEERIGEFFFRVAAAKEFTALGAPGEKAVLPLLSSANIQVRQEICGILAKIGTPESIPAIETAVTSLAKRDQPRIKVLAERAVREIRKRADSK